MVMGRKGIAKCILGVGWGYELKSGRNSVPLVTETQRMLETGTKVMIHYEFRPQLGPGVVSKVTTF